MTSFKTQVNKFLKQEQHSSEFFGDVYVVDGSNLRVCTWNLKFDHSYESYAEQHFPVVLFIMLYKLRFWLSSRLLSL